jgi:hypothetical protein
MDGFSDQSEKASPDDVKKDTENLSHFQSEITESVLGPFITSIGKDERLYETRTKVIREHGLGADIVHPMNREILDDLRIRSFRLYRVIEEQINRQNTAYGQLVKMASTPPSRWRPFLLPVSRENRL